MVSWSDEMNALPIPLIYKIFKYPSLYVLDEYQDILDELFWKEKTLIHLQLPKDGNKITQGRIGDWKSVYYYCVNILPKYLSTIVPVGWTNHKAINCPIPV